VIHPDYLDYRERFVVNQERAEAPKKIVLEPVVRYGTIRLQERLEDGATVLIDEAEVALQAGAGVWDVKHGKHLVQVFQPNRRVWQTQVKVTSKESNITLEPKNGDLAQPIEVKVSEAAKVFVNGTEIKGTSRSPALNPDVVHRLALETNQLRWETALTFPELGRDVLFFDVGALPRAIAVADVAWLLFRTQKTTWSIEVEGEPTGLSTFPGVTRRVAVKPGKCLVSLRRGNLVRELKLDLPPGSSVLVDVDLSQQIAGR
jgi:hypothetical protein